jgi:apolipoprotein N-acyltransferase
MPEQAVAARVPAGRERERSVVTGVGVLLLLLWLGFAVHRSPSFPGSLAGFVLAVAGAALMVLPSLAYAAVKRVRPLKRRITARWPLPRWLAWHVYTGIIGAVLALLHSAHRFDSTLGIALTAMMLLTVFSGYVGRHFLRYVSIEVREKQQLLDQLIATYNHIAGETAAQPVRLAVLAVSSNRWSRLRRRVMSTGRAAEDHVLQQAHRAVQVADAIADLEYSIKAHEVLKRRSRVWLVVHIVTSMAFYVLLALHVWAAFYFGLRWLA